LKNPGIITEMVLEMVVLEIATEEEEITKEETIAEILVVIAEMEEILETEETLEMEETPEIQEIQEIQETPETLEIIMTENPMIENLMIESLMSLTIERERVHQVHLEKQRKRAPERTTMTPTLQEVKILVQSIPKKM